VSEPERRSLLRPHAEMCFSADQKGNTDKENRRSLDVALGALTMLEIGYETGVVTDQPVASIPQAENLRTLFKSEAFLRYVNAYLYFGIRFLAWRIIPTTRNDRDRSSRKRSTGQEMTRMNGV
jgi:hypothetical protein